MNEHYRRLAFDLDDGNKGDFLSGWQCENPIAETLVAKVRARCGAVDFTRYTYFDAHEELVQKLSDFHANADCRRPEGILCGPGASPLLATLVAFLADRGYRVVYYVPPVYHSIVVGLKRYGIAATAASDRQAYEPGFELQLPDDEGALLILTDPAWYCGTVLPESAFQQLIQWQFKTGSVVLVDGSFQYLPWNGSLFEQTSGLDPNLTYRLVNPCKQLAIHGYRFAYLTMPKHSVDKIAWISTNLTGPASAESIEFAHEAVKAMTEQVIPRSLISIVKNRYKLLLDRKKIILGPEPVCGYSVFCKIVRSLPADSVLMDGRYFDQPRYPMFVKVNLLSPSIDMLLE